MIVDMVLNALPHYRGGLVSELETRTDVTINWIIGEPVRPSKFDTPRTDIPLACEKRVKNRLIRFGPSGRSMVWQSGVIKQAFCSDADQVIFTGDPHIVTNWIAAAIYRVRGVRILMWTHGWLRLDRGLKRFVRLGFYNLADGLLLYNDRSARLAVAHGFKKQVSVIYNSNGAPIREAPPVVSTARAGGMQRWIIVGRLVPNKGFEVAFEAVDLLSKTGREVELVVVGDGPLREQLLSLAASRGINVRFVGPVYSPVELNKYLDESDLLISPSNVGLSAMQALARGVPVGTSKFDDFQMPEAEAIRHGVTGVRFDPADTVVMAEEVWRFVESTDRRDTFSSCVSEYLARWTPEKQASLLADALSG